MAGDVAVPLLRVDAILISTSNGTRLVEFYRDVLGMPLKCELHEDTALHWGCYIADVHFAIHQIENFPRSSGTFSISFEVENVDDFVESLISKSIDIEIQPHSRSFGRLAAVRDPDDNLVYIHAY
jgi:catechol 2,3-dioxygenase-like lactoylglutathione lyase family enzyme